jgi:hypothetical protein
MKTFEKMKISHFSSGKLVNGKDVIVVLFSNWKISCFDKELNLIWNNDFLSSIKMSEPKLFNILLILDKFPCSLFPTEFIPGTVGWSF